MQHKPGAGQFKVQQAGKLSQALSADETTADPAPGKIRKVEFSQVFPGFRGSSWVSRRFAGAASCLVKRFQRRPASPAALAWVK